MTCEKLGSAQHITFSDIPTNHSNVLPSLNHIAIAVLDTSFVENASHIEQQFVESFSETNSTRFPGHACSVFGQ